MATLTPRQIGIAVVATVLAFPPAVWGAFPGLAPAWFAARLGGMPAALWVVLLILALCLVLTWLDGPAPDAAAGTTPDGGVR